MLKLGVVIFGASTYDHHRELNNPRFANSAKQFLTALCNPEIIPDCRVSPLDLYDEPSLPSETLLKITDFVSQDFDTVIIYYCGHGDVALKAREYRVFLRKSKKNLRATTMLDVNGLIYDIEGMSSEKTVYFVLDACFSGAAIQEFMDAGGTEALIDRSLSQTITQRGVAIFAATSGSDVALTKKGDKLSLFTGAFVRCLNEGIPYKANANKLSWLDVRDEIARSTRDRLGPDAPIPKIMSADDKFGDITRVPFFLNRSYVPSKKSNVTAEELYWRNLPDDPPLAVLHDFLTRFPDGIFSALARALADEQIGRLPESDLQEYLRYNTKTKFKRQIAARLASIKRDRIRNSNDVAALEAIVAENPSDEFAIQAGERIDFIRRQLAELEAWERVKMSDVPAELEQFLRVYLEGRFSGLARARLTELVEVVGHEVPQPARLLEMPQSVPLLGRMGERARSLAPHWRRLGLGAAFAALVGAAVLVSIHGRYAVTFESIRKELDAAGTDLVRLRAFVAHCAAISCALEQEARFRLAGAEADETARFARIAGEDRKALDAAKGNLGQLRAFVQQCNANCTVAQEARELLAKAEADEKARLTRIAAEDRKALDAAKGNLGQLHAFVQQCNANSCTVAQEARDLLAKAEADETARLARIAAEDRKALDAAKGNLGQLRAFVQQCNANSCTVAQEARELLAKAEADEKARLTRIAAEDRKALDAAKGNLGQLRAFVQQCNANSCTVAQEARDLLPKAEADEKARLARIAEDRKALDAAKGNLGQLRAFVQQCNANSCTVAQEARDLLAKAEGAETTRLARVAEDRKALEAAKGNLGQLRAFVRQCDASPCTVAQEARDLLAKEEAAETERLAHIAEQNKPKPVAGFSAIVGYDMNGGDIDSPEFLTRDTNAATCLAKCQAISGCIAYSFDKWIKTCYLKSRLASLTLDPRSDTSIRKDQTHPGFLNSPKGFCHYPSLAVVSDRPSIPFSAPNARICEQSCQSDQTCAAYLFRQTDKQCWLLTDTVDRKKGKGYENFTSGVKTQIQCN